MHVASVGVMLELTQVQLERYLTSVIQLVFHQSDCLKIDIRNRTQLVKKILFSHNARNIHDACSILLTGLKPCWMAATVVCTQGNVFCGTLVSIEITYLVGWLQLSISFLQFPALSSQLFHLLFNSGLLHLIVSSCFPQYLILLQLQVDMFLCKLDYN